ncbi:MAG: TRAP transporter large permease [Defluviitaleaceae bacterium]|nr:TRAP transporter large permease [Defluviitaleaceae bacterium]
MTVLLLGSLLFLLGLGVPVFAALGLSSLIVSMESPLIMSTSIPQRMFFGLDMFGLMAIPYFMFCAEIMGRGQIGKKLVLVCRAFFGHLPGGMAIATVVASLIFGAFAGAGVAALVAFGGLIIGLMKEGKYSDEFSAGLISTTSTLAMVLPPSIVQVVFATITGTSVAALFLAGISAGVLYGIILALFCLAYGVWRKLPLLEKVPWSQRWKPLRESFWALSLIVVMLGGIYGGIMSVTEAAGVAAFYAMVVEVFVYRTLKLKDLFKAAISAGRMIAMVMILLSSGAVLAHVMTIMQLPHQMAALLSDTSPLVLLLLINLIFLIVGMFIDPTSTIIILTPLLFPAAMSAGIDPIHLGTLIILNVSIGMLTPPCGLNLFVASSIFKLSFSQITRGMLPFILISIILLIVLTFIPGITTFLPSMFM